MQNKVKISYLSPFNINVASSAQNFIDVDRNNVRHNRVLC